jgi:hypothetical protein
MSRAEFVTPVLTYTANAESGKIQIAVVYSVSVDLESDKKYK